MKQLGFNETLEQRDYGNFILLGQSYTEFDDETNEEKDIYNVSIEYIVDENYSQTLDLFESYDLEETEKYFPEDTVTIQTSALLSYYHSRTQN